MASPVTIATYIMMLGLNVRDRVTGFKGMLSSVSFDVYGCVQGLVTPPIVDGKLQDMNWFDLKRLDADGERVFAAPVFSTNQQGVPGGNHLPGPARVPVQ